MDKKVSYFLAGMLLFVTVALPAQVNQDKLQTLIDSLRVTGNFPGLSVAIESENGNWAFVSGYNDIEKASKLHVTDKFLQGSVGKTYVAAIAMQLVENKQLSLDSKVSDYLGDYPWYNQVPNAKDITVRMLMNHTSGIMRYEFKESFTTDLTNNPDKFWKPEELIKYVLNETPAFEAGKGWEYSDTNYILLGLIIEKITRQSYYSILEKSILKRFKLKETLPSSQKKLHGLVQGYAGKNNAFGGKEKMIEENGAMIINPQFEWTGGGLYSTTRDLARWGKLLYEGKAFNNTLVAGMVEGVPATLGKNVSYGLGVIVRQSSFGVSYGHSGFFPGYLTEMAYFPDYKICVAVQTNSSDFKNLNIPSNKIILSVLKRVVEQQE